MSPPRFCRLRKYRSLFCAPIADEEWNVKDEEDCEPDCFQFNNIPGPGSKEIYQGGEAGFVCDVKIVTADGKVDEEDDDHVDICPNKDTFEGLQGGTESFHDCHVYGNIDQQPMRNEGLHDTKMREIISGSIGRGEHGLHGYAKSHEVH